MPGRQQHRQQAEPEQAPQQQAAGSGLAGWVGEAG